jgi:hypothetical protein
MARYVFTSFRFAYDHWRAQMVRNMGSVEGNSIMNPSDWEQVKRQGDDAVRRWIDRELKGKSCNVVLIGAHTTSRKWIKHEMRKAWDDGKGVLGIYIHKLKDKEGKQDSKGANPLDEVTVGDKTLSKIAKTYDPPQASSEGVYDYIKGNIENWIEEAIDIRNDYNP